MNIFYVPRYLIDNKWFKQWKRYVGYDSWDACNIGEQSTFPGPIDNSPLLKGKMIVTFATFLLINSYLHHLKVNLYQFTENGGLKEHLIDELDYVLVPEDAWDSLKSWYSVVDGQEPICRNVVEFGMFVKHCKVWSRANFTMEHFAFEHWIYFFNLFQGWSVLNGVEVMPEL